MVTLEHCVVVWEHAKIDIDHTRHPPSRMIGDVLAPGEQMCCFHPADDGNSRKMMSRTILTASAASLRSSISSSVHQLSGL
eukprot:2051923-Amphidinium_carterae.1